MPLSKFEANPMLHLRVKRSSFSVFPLVSSCSNVYFRTYAIIYFLADQLVFLNMVTFYLPFHLDLSFSYLIYFFSFDISFSSFFFSLLFYYLYLLEILYSFPSLSSFSPPFLPARASEQGNVIVLFYQFLLLLSLSLFTIFFQRRDCILSIQNNSSRRRKLSDGLRR